MTMGGGSFVERSEGSCVCTALTIGYQSALPGNASCLELQIDQELHVHGGGHGRGHDRQEKKAPVFMAMAMMVAEAEAPLLLSRFVVVMRRHWSSDMIRRDRGTDPPPD